MCSLARYNYNKKTTFPIDGSPINNSLSLPCCRSDVENENEAATTVWKMVVPPHISYRTVVAHSIPLRLALPDPTTVQFRQPGESSCSHLTEDCVAPRSFVECNPSVYCGDYARCGECVASHGSWTKAHCVPCLDSDENVDFPRFLGPLGLIESRAPGRAPT